MTGADRQSRHNIEEHQTEATKCERRMYASIRKGTSKGNVKVERAQSKLILLSQSNSSTSIKYTLIDQIIINPIRIPSINGQGDTGRHYFQH